MSSSIGNRAAKDALFDGFARVAASLAADRRLEIVDVLAQAPRTVEALAAAIDQTVANTSHHLRRMAADGLITAERQGRYVTYRLASPQVHDLWQALQAVAAAHYGEIETRAGAYLGDRGQIREIGHDTLRQRMGRGDVVVIDVRPETEYRAGHIDGAINVPPDRLDQLLPALPPDRDVVAYCRGRYCAYADQAVRRLQAAGRTAYRLEHGYPEWDRSSVRASTPSPADGTATTTNAHGPPADGVA